MVVFECEPELNDIIWQESEYVSFLDCATTGVISRDSVFSFTGNGGGSSLSSKKVLYSNLDSPMLTLLRLLVL